MTQSILNDHETVPEVLRDAILNALPNPVVMIDDAGKVRFANVAAEAFFCTGASVLRRGSLDELVPFSSPLLALVEQTRHHDAPINEYAVEVGTPGTGGRRTVDLQVAPVPELPGGILIVFQPRTMAQKIDRQLTHIGAARSVSGMASMLAHEIKNPLSGIRGAAQLLESAVSETDQSLTRLICDESDRICALVDQMEVFSDQRPLSVQPINIHVVLDHVTSIARNGFAKTIKFSQNYDPSLPSVPGDRNLLVQLFLNLVKNAAEAIALDSGDGEIAMSTAFRPGIRLTVPGTGERVSLPLECCIKDNGPGVPEELKQHLFDPFITTKVTGKGLGLALVAKVVRDHGGVIECEREGRWTVFRILLPMHQTHKATPVDIDRDRRDAQETTA